MDFNFRRELGKMTPRISEGARIYIFGAGANWDQICKLYRYLVNIDISEYVDGFIDNDAGKQGTLFHGKAVCALSEIDLRNSVILICVASDNANNDIGKHLASVGMHWRRSFFTCDCFMILLMRWEYLRLRQFQGRHKGERCFVIGNGPSLTAGDLDKLKGETTFATNRIYLMFSRTGWRPSYYAVHDASIIKNYHKSIKDKVTCPIFYAANSVCEIDEFSFIDDYFYFIDLRNDWKPDPSGEVIFSEDPLILQWGATVTYDCLQLAAYMGFKEIYLLGMDHTFPLAIKKDGALITNEVDGHFTESYHSKSSPYNCAVDMSTAAYQAAKEYADSHNIKIRNATRGGKLEVFERVDFDSLF